MSMYQLDRLVFLSIRKIPMRSNPYESSQSFLAFDILGKSNDLDHGATATSTSRMNLPRSNTTYFNHTV